MKVNCHQCGGDMSHKRKGAMYCSDSCRQRSVRQNNPGVNAAKCREYGRANSKENAARAKQWREDNPEKYADSMEAKRDAYCLEMYGKVIKDPLLMSKDRFAKARALGYRSGLEVKVATDLKDKGIPFGYETEKIKFTEPAKNRTYTPDFVLTKKDGTKMFIETKGRLVAADRQKHKFIKEQCPDIDLRIVFTNQNSKIYKGSPTTHAKWAEKLGLQYANRVIPIDWIKECM